MIIFFTYLFWLSFGFIVYAYLGYPLILYLLSRLRQISVSKKGFIEWPEISCIIAVKNEEKNIEGRIINILEQDYPLEKMEIIIVSDGSTDDTVKIAERFRKRDTRYSVAIKIIDRKLSSGKPTALNAGILEARGEIIVFADCRQRFEKNAIKELVSNFNDESIGSVSGELLFKDPTSSHDVVEMGAYWKYEKMIRKMESSTGSVMGATGAIYAIRRALYRPIPDHILLDDVLIPLQIVKQGYRNAFDSSAIAYDTLSENIGQEWSRKVRTLAGNWQFINHAPYFFNPMNRAIFWRFISHKFLRLIVPFMLVILFAGSFILDGWFYFSMFALQFCFYFIAVLTARSKFLRNNSILRIIYFFCVLNSAALFAFFYWITGKCENLWIVNQNKATQDTNKLNA